MVILFLKLLKSLLNDELCVTNLPLACVMAETVDVFDSDSDHVGLLGTDAFQLG